MVYKSCSKLAVKMERNTHWCYSSLVAQTNYFILNGRNVGCRRNVGRGGKEPLK